MKKSRIFIASSVESIKLAYAAQKALRHAAEATVWSQGIFELSGTTLESLLRKLDEFDFGVFIFSPDDITNIRGKESRTVRDNVIFELGLFIGHLGKECSFIVAPQNNNELHLPSGLLGITIATYETDRDDGNVEAALGPACFDIETAMDIYNSCSGAAQEKDSGIDVVDSKQLHPEKKETQSNIKFPSNPFNPVGTLRTADSTYVKRECDQELSIALRENRQIAVIGEYRIGKSSLSRQIPLYVKDEWRTCFIDFQGIRTDSVQNFMIGFFKGISRVFGSTDSLDGLADNLKNQPAILCLDEFGRLTPEIATCLIPNLFWLSNEVGDFLRIVICLPTHITQFLSSLKIDNPKYVRDWKHIALKPFERNQAAKLLEILPENVRRTAQSNLDLIMRLSSGRPQALQSLCYRLFEANYDIRTETGFVNIINDQNSYI